MSELYDWNAACDRKMGAVETMNSLNSFKLSKYLLEICDNFSFIGNNILNVFLMIAVFAERDSIKFMATLREIAF